VQPSTRPLRSIETEDDAHRFRMSTPMIVGLAAVVVVLIAALFIRSYKPKPHPAPKAQTESTESAPAPAPKPTPQRSSREPNAKGAVAERVMPDVPERASRTIRGKVSVRIRASVDRNGEVSNATIESDGHSRYFGNLALQAARKWRFKPARVDGRSAPSTWSLRFDFRRGKTEVNPVEVTP